MLDGVGICVAVFNRGRVPVLRESVLHCEIVWEGESLNEVGMVVDVVVDDVFVGSSVAEGVIDADSDVDGWEWLGEPGLLELDALGVTDDVVLTNRDLVTDAELE